MAASTVPPRFSHRVPDNGQSQTRAAGSAGPCLVHPIEPLKDPGQVLFRDAGAVVLHRQHHLIPLPKQGDLDRAARRRVLHGVVRQIIDDLVDLIPGGQHRTGPLRPIGQFRSLLLGHQAHHPHHLLQHRQRVHHHRPLQHVAVQPGQAEQILCDTGEALRLLPDVCDKFPGRLPVDVLRLEDGVRQQPDGRQGRFQLVGGVGHKAAAGVLRSLEAVRQAVELLGQLGDLVMAPDLRPVAVGALPHLADGG